MTAIAGNLIETDVVVEVGHGKSDGGRRPRLLDVNAGLGFVAGVDIGATSVDLALADFQGTILVRDCFEADVRNAPEDLLARINQEVADLLKTQRADPTSLLGMGLGVPGPVHYPTGRLIQPPLMPA